MNNRANSANPPLETINQRNPLLRRYAKALWPIVLVALSCTLVGCSGDDETDALEQLAAGEASGMGACVSCGDGPCGYCVEMSAERIYRCSGDLAPEAANCLKTPSVFAENNVNYICWYCK